MASSLFPCVISMLIWWVKRSLTMASKRPAFLRLPVRARMGNRFPPCRSRLPSLPGCHGLPTTGGLRRSIYAGQGTQDHIRTAIQLLSGEVPKEIVYAHLGWKKINGEWIYLHGGGGIGRNGLIRDLSVSLGDGRMKDYILPEPPTGDQLKRALRASLRLLELAPVRITFPLIAATYRAPLGEIVPIDFSTLLGGLYWDPED